MNLPRLLTGSGKLLLQLPVWSACDLNLLRVAILGFAISKLIGTRITSTILSCRTLCDRHFAVAQKDYRAVVGLVNML